MNEDYLIYTLIKYLPNKFKRNLRIMNYNININLYRVYYFFDDFGLYLSIIPNDCFLFPSIFKDEYKYQIKLLNNKSNILLNSDEVLNINKNLFNSDNIIRDKIIYYKNSFELINDILLLHLKLKNAKFILKKFIIKSKLINKSRKIINKFVNKYKYYFFYKPPDKFNINGGLYYKKAFKSFLNQNIRYLHNCAPI